MGNSLLVMLTSWVVLDLFYYLLQYQVAVEVEVVAVASVDGMAGTRNSAYCC